MRHAIKWALPVTAALMGSGISGLSAKQNSCDDPILIGTTISMSGPLATLTGNWDKMTQVFADEINKTGGVMMSSCGKRVPIKFVVYDDQGNPATGVSLHERMATVDNVDVFAGTDWTFVVMPVSTVAEKHKIPIVGGNVATPAAFERGLKYFWSVPYPMTYNWDANYFDMLKNVEPKPKTMFWITQDNPVFKSVRDFWAKRYEEIGIKVVGDETFPNDLKDFSSVVLKVRSARPDIVYINSFDNVATPLITQLRQQRVRMMGLHFPIVSLELGRQTKASGGIEGITGVVGWIPGVKSEFGDFMKTVLDKAGVNVFESATVMPRFTSYLVMIQALERAGAVDREKVREALFKGTFRGPTGPINFDEKGQPDTRTLITQNQDGNVVVVWPPNLSTGKLKWPAPSWQ